MKGYIVYTCMLLVLQSTPMSVHTGGREGGGKAEVPSNRGEGGGARK